MRKRLKKKKRSCSLCKPHKTGGSNRWSSRQEFKLKLAEKEMKDAVKR